MQRESLATVLREARSDWSARDLAAVQSKLAKVGIGTSEDLAKALQNQLNERLREAGLKAFSNETVQALKRCLDVEPLMSMQVQEAGLGELAEAEPRLVPEEPPAEAQTYGQRAAAPWAETEEPLTHVQPEPATGDGAGRRDFGVAPSSEAPVPEEAPGDMMGVVALAKGQGISVEKLVQPSKAEALLRQVDGLESMTLPELQAMYEEHGCPADRRMRKKELVAGVRNILVWEQLVVSALQEVCEREGLAVKKTQPRAELLRLLRDAKWEALGIPIQRLPSFEAARCLLEQVQDLEGLDPQQLAAQCHSWGVPVVPLEFRQNPSAERSPEYMAAQLKQAFVWKEMPTSELRRDCRAFGVALDDLDSSAQAEELLERLMQSLWGNRWEGHGVPLERLKSLKAAEELMKQMERLQAMGTLSLQVECNRLGVPFNAQMEDALLEERLKDALIWRQLPPAELQRDCKLLDIAPAGARESLPARLLRRKDTLREWEAQGIPVSRFGGDYHKALELHKEYKSISMMSRKGLEKWYRSIGFPEEKEIEKSELERLYKKVRFWDMLSTDELEQDVARLASASAITAKNEKEKRADLTFQLFKHERLVAWDKRGFHALRIGNADLAAQIVIATEHPRQSSPAMTAPRPLCCLLLAGMVSALRQPASKPSAADQSLLRHLAARSKEDALAATGQGPPLDTGQAPRPAICIEGRAAPQVYLLGVQKAGTSTLAGDLAHAGLASAISDHKGLHLFDKNCGFDFHCDKGYRMFPSEEGEEEPHSGVCNSKTFDVAAWASNFRRCEEGGGPYADMTVVNHRLPGLPAMLKKIYGKNASSLVFVLALREPLHRMQSGFYHTRMKFLLTERAKGFEDYVQMVRERWPSVERNNSEALALDYPLDQLYRSMYGVNLAPWLKVFRPRQFVLVPMTQYFGSLEARRAAISLVSEKAGAELQPDLVTFLGHANKHRHSALEVDLGMEAIGGLQSAFFEPDAQRLGELLAPAVKRGLKIAGYKGAPDAAAIKQYLVSNW